MAILSSAPKRESTSKISSSTNELPQPIVNNPRNRQQHLNNTKAKIERILKDIEESETSCLVKLGDASIAAPFTSKFSSIQCSNYRIIFTLFQN